MNTVLTPRTLAAAAAEPQVVELRQYTLHPGRRDTLIALFEREFVEPLQVLGMPVLGSFTDLDDPDRFVWLRGFRDMASRATALPAFYDGPVWQRHREQANATMVDSDDVLLLRPASLPWCAARDAPRSRDGLITATVCPLRRPPVGDELATVFERSLRPAWEAEGAELLACQVTEAAPNNYPRLPVREGESVWIWWSRFASPAAQQRHAAELAACADWRGTHWPAWREFLSAEPTTLRLRPTAHSALQA